MRSDGSTANALIAAKSGSVRSSPKSVPRRLNVGLHLLRSGGAVLASQNVLLHRGEPPFRQIPKKILFQDVVPEMLNGHNGHAV